MKEQDKVVVLSTPSFDSRRLLQSGFPTQPFSHSLVKVLLGLSMTSCPAWLRLKREWFWAHPWTIHCPYHMTGWLICLVKAMKMTCRGRIALWPGSQSGVFAHNWHVASKVWFGKNMTISWGALLTLDQFVARNLIQGLSSQLADRVV